MVRSVGTVAVDSKLAVDSDTLFLIASCSKPFASLCVLDLINNPDIDLKLESPIDQWLPGFGKPERAPTVEELLSHRAGIYSQKSGMTRPQARWIRKFDHTLAEATDGIASFPLISPPGSKFAYSGAGYCVLGRVAELAAKKPFETIFQERICQPLSLSHTTYFPALQFQTDEIATGFAPKNAPHALGKAHQFPLIGGSLYSTAGEMATFAEAVSKEWKSTDGKGPFGFKSDLIHELGRSRSSNNGYSLGWSVMLKNRKPARISHGGSLQSYRSWIAIDLETGTAVAACWTLSRPNSDAPIKPLLQKLL